MNTGVPSTTNTVLSSIFENPSVFNQGNTSDPLTRTYDLKAGSIAIDKGVKLGPLYDENVVEEPDLGWKEFGSNGSGAPYSDTQAPAAPKFNASTNNTETTTTLNWTAPSDGNGGVAYYEITPIGAPAELRSIYYVDGTSLTLKDLKPSTTYKFDIVAVDGMGNRSSSGPVTSTSGDLLEEGFSVFPNPSNGTFEIVALENFSKIQIYNSSGNMVYEGTSKMIETAGLAKGLYVIYAYGTKKVLQSKMVML
jgi:hypothetical protein